MATQSVAPQTAPADVGLKRERGLTGGTARFPHLAFGSVAGISFGFFSWLQAVTVAPIECFAVMQYGHYYWHGIYNPSANGGNGNVTGVGFLVTSVLVAVVTPLD